MPKDAKYSITILQVSKIKIVIIEKISNFNKQITLNQQKNKLNFDIIVKLYKETIGKLIQSLFLWLIYKLKKALIKY